MGQTMRDKTDMVNARDHVISCFRNDNLRIFPLATKLEQLATKVDVEELWAHVMRLQEEETSHVSRGASRGGGYMGGDWARVHDDILLTKIPMHPSSDLDQELAEALDVGDQYRGYCREPITLMTVGKREKVRTMLQMWKEMQGREVSVAKMMEALERVGPMT